MTNAIVASAGNQNVQSGNFMTPSNMMEAMKLAEMMAQAQLVPAALQKHPADCLLVIEQAMRWGMSPFAVAQAVSVISGKLMFEGKLVAAVINANGNLQERLSYDYSGAGDDRTIRVSGLLKGERKPRDVEVVLRNVRTSNKVWSTQPDQQLMYHGARVWARRHMPELMLGVYSPEEFETIDNGSPMIEQPKEEIKSVIIPAPKPKEESENYQLTESAKEFAKEIDLADSDEKLEIVVRRFVETTGKLATKLPKWHEKLLKLLENKRASFVVAAPENAAGREILAG